MVLNLNKVTEDEIKSSAKKALEGFYTTDMCDYYSDKIVEASTQIQDKIFGVPRTEVCRQCEASCDVKPFDMPFNPSREPMDTVLEGGEKILGDEASLKLINHIYRGKN